MLIYAIDRHCVEHEACRATLERCQRSPFPWYLTWSVLYEFLRVASHPRVFRQPLRVAQAWDVVAKLLDSPSLEVLIEGPRHADVAAQTLSEVAGLCGNLLHDAHTAILMREHGIRRIYTRDADFHRFPFLDVIDPLSEKI